MRDIGISQKVGCLIPKVKAHTITSTCLSVCHPPIFVVFLLLFNLSKVGGFPSLEIEFKAKEIKKRLGPNNCKIFFFPSVNPFRKYLLCYVVGKRLPA